MLKMMRGELQALHWASQHPDPISRLKSLKRKCKAAPESQLELFGFEGPPDVQSYQYQAKQSVHLTSWGRRLKHHVPRRRPKHKSREVEGRQVLLGACESPKHAGPSRGDPCWMFSCGALPCCWPVRCLGSTTSTLATRPRTEPAILSAQCAGTAASTIHLGYPRSLKRAHQQILNRITYPLVPFALDTNLETLCLNTSCREYLPNYDASSSPLATANHPYVLKS